MNKMRIEGDSYYNDYHFRKKFDGRKIPKEFLPPVVDFAYKMCFGEGHHRDYRTGGELIRGNGEKFCNTFQGKLAEVILRKIFIKQGLECGEVDFNVFGKGIWDDTDLVVNGNTLSIKSAAHFSNLLLLESKDYNSEGQYLPNLSVGATASYDYYILVRIKPDIKGEFKKQWLLKSNDISREKIYEIINSCEWEFDIAGWISHDELVSVITNKHMIPQGALLNGKTQMDAENYYVQSGDMHKIKDLIPILKA